MPQRLAVARLTTPAQRRESAMEKQPHDGPLNPEQHGVEGMRSPAPEVGAESVDAVRGRVIDRVCLVVVLTGILLRVFQYLANAPLFTDEAALVHSLLTRSLAELFTPLDYAQTTPPGFLLVQFLTVRYFGASEYWLRLYPLLMGVAAVLLFWRLCRATLPRTAVPVALVLFSVSHYLIYFSATFKQYSSDVTFSVALLLVGVCALRRGVRGVRAVMIAAVGGLALWFSQPQVFVAAGIGLGLAIVAWRRGDWSGLRNLAFIGFVWAVNAVLVYMVARAQMTEGDRAYFYDFWEDGFPPLLPRTRADLLWYAALYRRMFADLIWSPIAGICLIAGVAVLWRRRDPRLLVLALPIAAAFTGAALRQYPLGGDSAGEGRVLLFLFPCLVLLIAVGTEWARTRLRHPLSFAVFFNLLLILPVYQALAGFPYSREDPRSVLDRISQQANATDLIYVHYNVRHSFDYYAARLGLGGHARTYGTCSRDEWRGYLRGVEALPAGARVWLVFGWHRRIEGGDEQPLILSYMDEFGSRLQYIEGAPATFWHPGPGYRGPAAHLYLLGAARPDIEDFAPFPEDLGAFAAVPKRLRCGGIWVR
jgi:hypothetical protein